MITLLNGEHWAKEEILANMADDDFYFNFLGKHALSQSLLKNILDDPHSYLKKLKGKEEKKSDALMMGSLVHWGYLEPDVFYSKKFIEAERITDKPYKLAVEKYGSENVYKAKFQRIAESYIDALNRCDKLNDIKKNCEIEVPAIKMFFDDIPIRGKADLLASDTIYDLKTTMVNPNEFNKWKIINMHYDLQAFIYCQLFEVDYFSFIPINKQNKAKGIVHCGKEILESGEEKFYKAMEKYKKYFYKKDIEESEYILDNDCPEIIIG